MAEIGYARVSTVEQDLSAQIDELERAGCTKIYSEKISGAKSDRPEFDTCMAALTNGDTLVCQRLDRVGRSMLHLVSVVNELRERNIHFKSLHDGNIDTTTASGELVFNIFASFAQFERRLIQERTNIGLQAARARGKKGGRKAVDADHKTVVAAKKLHADKTMSINDICKTLKISRATLYRYLKM
jgi:DNA invertase Pin-like site-specific DNA recombinase